jgi:hypothetical protein
MLSPRWRWVAGVAVVGLALGWLWAHTWFHRVGQDWTASLRVGRVAWEAERARGRLTLRRVGPDQRITSERPIVGPVWMEYELPAEGQ